MNTKFCHRVGVVLFCVALFGFELGFVVPQANAQTQLVQVANTSVVMPGPGRVSEWSMQITKIVSKPVALSLSLQNVSADKAGLLDLLTISVTDDKGNVVLPPTVATNIGVKPVFLRNLVTSQMVLKGTVALDVSADNQYQNVDGVLDFQIVATPADTTTIAPPVSEVVTAPPVKDVGILAYTGFAVGGLLVIAISVLVVGILLKIFRVRRRS